MNSGCSRSLWPLLVLLALQACTTPVSYPPRTPAQPPPIVEQGSQAPEEQRRPAPATPSGSAPSVPVQQTSPAVVALLDTAEQQANAGNLEAASASLERAIRIDPRNAVLWYHLATVRLAQGDPLSAEQLAMKSSSLAPGNTIQQARNWQLIADARAARQDQAGAAAAAQRARELGGR